MAGAGPRIETRPFDEIPAPVPAVEADVSGLARRQNGTSADSESAKKLGSLGGRAKATKVRFARSMGLLGYLENPDFEPFRKEAEAFRRFHCAELAKKAGGVCDSGPSSIVASAALALAASRFLYAKAARTGETDLFVSAARLADSSKQALAMAREMAIADAKARPKSYADPLAKWRSE